MDGVSGQNERKRMVPAVGSVLAGLFHTSTAAEQGSTFVHSWTEVEFYPLICLIVGM